MCDKYKVAFTDDSIGYTHSFLTKEYEDEKYQVIYLKPELLKSAYITDGMRWPKPFNEWEKNSLLGGESKPDFFIRSFAPNNDDKDTITWMPTVFRAEEIAIKRTIKEWIFNQEPRKKVRVGYKNGRHRTEFFRHLGAEYIPVLTTRSLIKTLERMKLEGKL